MAIKNIRTVEDNILKKVSKPVKEINDKIITLLDDMTDTMIDRNGVGLAAVQVGALRRVAIIDAPNTEEFGEDYDDEIIEMINPEILEINGQVIKNEGCLSIPGKAGTVSRPENLKVKFLNRDGESVIIEATGYRARAISHELDHLDGILFTDKVIEFTDNEK
ncbi:MAG: peptide deformylase [Defluviitaleaceae bacterium]|nr:peptide deformylase [Defluviitaleaceae bacterium]